MQRLMAQFFAQLAHSNAILVRVQATQGSVPREVGAWMAVFADCSVATVGGQVTLVFSPVSAQDQVALAQQLRPAQMPVALFGSGHVGTAIVQVLGLLPVALSWIDSRDQPFPPDLPIGVHFEHSKPVQGAVAHLVPQSRVLVMSFSHAEDLDIVQACLLRQRARGDLPFIGLIGSKTKWATFRHRLEAKGFSAAELAHVTCPIGIAGIYDKRPEVIAVAVAAQLLLLAA